MFLIAVMKITTRNGNFACHVSHLHCFFYLCVCVYNLWAFARMLWSNMIKKSRCWGLHPVLPVFPSQPRKDRKIPVNKTFGRMSRKK